ncbi:MAG: peptidoglycan-binding domain-containing protein [Ignavibacteriaceae bacterium]|nr:peptidoglycan-binding domain-containing protein [Ignavibacteriaceae bacterium]
MAGNIKSTLKAGCSGDNVKVWQRYLRLQKFYNGDIDGDFGQGTTEATKAFQTAKGLFADGKVGNITWGFISSMNHPAPDLIKSEADLFKWIHENLGNFIQQSIKNTIYTEDWLGSIAARETGFLIVKYVNRGKGFDEIRILMKGDFRGGIYHGYGFWQADINSYHQFIVDGKWQDVQACSSLAIDCLERKRKFLIRYFPYADLSRAITAAYNTGEGNVFNSLVKNHDVDLTTFNGDYSKEVFRMRDIYKKII